MQQYYAARIDCALSYFAVLQWGAYTWMGQLLYLDLRETYGNAVHMQMNHLAHVRPITGLRPLTVRTQCRLSEDFTHIIIFHCR